MSTNMQVKSERESREVPESVPPPTDLAAIVAAENLRWEASRAEYIRKRDAVTFEVHYDLLNAEHEGDSTVTVTLHKTSTLSEAVEACLASVQSDEHIGDTTVTLNACRLRPYDTDSATPKGRALGTSRSHESNSDSSLEDLGLWKAW